MILMFKKFFICLMTMEVSVSQPAEFYVNFLIGLLTLLHVAVFGAFNYFEFNTNFSYDKFRATALIGAIYTLLCAIALHIYAPFKGGATTKSKVPFLGGFYNGSYTNPVLFGKLDVKTSFIRAGLIGSAWDRMKGRSEPKTDIELVLSKQRMRAALRTVKDKIEELRCNKVGYKLYRIKGFPPTTMKKEEPMEGNSNRPYFPKKEPGSKKVSRKTKVVASMYHSDEDQDGSDPDYKPSKRSPKTKSYKKCSQKRSYSKKTTKALKIEENLPVSSNNNPLVQSSGVALIKDKEVEVSPPPLKKRKTTTRSEKQRELLFAEAQNICKGELHNLLGIKRRRTTYVQVLQVVPLQ